MAIPMEMADSIVDVDDNHKDPQLCAALACDIYKHLRLAEVIFFFCLLKMFIISSPLFCVLVYVH